MVLATLNFKVRCIYLYVKMILMYSDIRDPSFIVDVLSNIIFIADMKM